MMELVRLALRRPYTVAVLSLLVLLLGVLAASRMIVDFFPKIDIPVVFVGWQYSGLSAEEMERRVVIVSERAYSTTVSGIERIESSCIPGVGLVKVFFHPGMDIGAAIAQINAINGTILRILPPGISPPVIIQYNPATVPIVNMTFSSRTLPEGRMFDHAFNFVRVKLFTIPGLQVPAPFGGRLRQISVDLDPTLMAAKGVSANDVVQAVQNQNLLIPSGTARIGTTDFNVLMNSSPATVDDFNRIPLKLMGRVPVSAEQHRACRWRACGAVHRAQERPGFDHRCGAGDQGSSARPARPAATRTQDRCACRPVGVRESRREGRVL